MQVPVCRLDPVGRRPCIFLGGSRDFVELGVVSLRDTWQNPQRWLGIGGPSVLDCRSLAERLMYRPWALGTFNGGKENDGGRFS